MNESAPPPQSPPKIPLAQEIRAALTGAARLFLFDTEALRLFNLSAGGFWRSFLAAPIAAPIYVLVFILHDRMIQAIPEASVDLSPIADRIRLQLISYPMDWLLFPIAMIGLARLLKVTPRYRTYITLYNWAGVITSFVTLLPLVLFGAGLIDAPSAPSACLAFELFSCVYLWFVVRTGLGVPGLTAAGLVAIDVLLTMLADELLARALGITGS